MFQSCQLWAPCVCVSVLESILHTSWVQWADNHYLVLHGHNTAPPPPPPPQGSDKLRGHTLATQPHEKSTVYSSSTGHTALTKSMYSTRSTIRPQDIARKVYNETLQYCYHSLKGIIIGSQIIGHTVTTMTCNIQPDNQPHSPEKASTLRPGYQ